MDLRQLRYFVGVSEAGSLLKASGRLHVAQPALGQQIAALEDEVGARLYERTNRVHDDGTLRTRHLTANVFVDIDEDADTATARSSFVVFQQTADLPLQPIVTGRYRDRFERVEGTWRFAQRHMIVDHVGDVREHLAFDISAYQAQPRN